MKHPQKPVIVNRNTGCARSTATTVQLAEPGVAFAPTPASCELATEADATYLDLDGDGVPDAVEMVETVLAFDAGSRRGRVVQVVRTVAAGIGEDGVPRRVFSTTSNH